MIILIILTTTIIIIIIIIIKYKSIRGKGNKETERESNNELLKHCYK